MSKIFEVIIEQPDIIMPTAKSVIAPGPLLGKRHSRFGIINIINPDNFVRPTGLERLRDVQPNQALRHQGSGNLWEWIASQDIGLPQNHFFPANMIDVKHFTQIGVEWIG